MMEEAKFRDTLVSFERLTRGKLSSLPHAFATETVIGRACDALERGEMLVLRGNAGVGKTAVLHAAARQLSVTRATESIDIYVTSVTHLLSGTPYVGWWQTKLAALVEEVAKQRELLHRTPLIYINDIANLFREWRGDQRKPIADDILPFIESGELWVAGEATPALFELLQDDARWARRVERVDVPEPSPADLQRILRSFAAAQAKRTGSAGAAQQAPDRETVRALGEAVALTRRFMPSIAQPGASLQVVRRAMTGGRLTTERVQESIAEVTGVPAEIVCDSIALSHEEVVKRLERRIIGQEEAVAAAADALLMVKAGLSNPRRPLLVAGFFGPSGVGKTELAKSLAQAAFGDDAHLVRFDMSEFVGPASAARLSEAIVSKVGLKPLSVCLFDEIEKADLNALDVLLQVMADGRCTSESGRTVSLRQSFVLLTSNVGFSTGEESSRRPAGFLGTSPADSSSATQQRVMEAVRSRFRPEFIGRIDRVLVFQPLGPDAIREIAERELDLALSAPGLAGRDLLVDVDESLREAIAREGLDPRYGARPLVAAIRERVSVPLARWVAANPRSRDRILTLVMDEAGDVSVAADE